MNEKTLFLLGVAIVVVVGWLSWPQSGSLPSGPARSGDSHCFEIYAAASKDMMERIHDSLIETAARDVIDKLTGLDDADRARIAVTKCQGRTDER